MKKLLTGLMAVVMMAGLAGCGSKDDGAGEGSDTAKKELTVYTNSGYKPYEMVDEKGDLYGFDIDVMNEAAKLAGYTVKWEDVDFDGIVPSVKQGKADIGIAGITYTEERAKQVDFSDVYYAGEDAQNYVLTMKSSGMKKTEDIKGKKIGTQMGTIQESILNSLQDEYKLKLDKRKAYSDMVLEMKKGVIDAMVVEKAVAEELAADNEDLSYYKFEAGAELAGNAMIFQKDNKLKDEFNKAIKTMKENGKMDELVKKYFK